MCTQYGWNFQPGWQLRNPNSLQPKQEPHDTIPGPRQSRELATHVGRRQVMKKVLRRDWCKLLHFSTCMKDPHSKHCLSSNLHVDPHRTRPDIAMIGNKNSFMHLSPLAFLQSSFSILCTSSAPQLKFAKGKRFRTGWHDLPLRTHTKDCS